MSGVEILILALGTVALLAATWSVSLKAARYHGVYRFFSFESILLLFLLNWRNWFADPFSWNQLLSWILLFGSIIPAVSGFYALHQMGKPKGQFENTTKLVREGPYRLIRHPLYASLVLLGTGICVKHPSLISLGLAAVNILAMVATARREEKEMVQKFGLDYEVYMKRTKMFIPYVL